MALAPPFPERGRGRVTWDPLQREVLEALGHEVLVRVAPPRPALPDDPLLHALLRAAGRSAADDDAWDLHRTWPPVSDLRGDARAKRALWPRLRALRRQVPQPR
jgi:DNA polymerase III psi subunit